MYNKYNQIIKHNIITKEIQNILKSFFLLIFAFSEMKYSSKNKHDINKKKRKTIIVLIKS